MFKSRSMISTLFLIFFISQVFAADIPAPRNLLVKPISNNEMSLTWKDMSNNEDGFRIERSSGSNDNFTFLFNVDSNTTDFTDTLDTDTDTVDTNGVYFYKVSAYKGEATSMYSNIYGATAADSPSPQISIQTRRAFEVGEEVIFHAFGSVELDAAGFYEWDFGDNEFNFSWDTEDDEQKNARETAIIASHVYSRPGTYTVTMTADNHPTVSVNITISGEYRKLAPLPKVEPVLALKFENDLNDSSPSELHGEWGTTGEGEFTKGMEGKAVKLSEGHHIIIPDPNDILGGKNQFTISFWLKRRTAYGKSTYIIRKGGDTFYLRFLGETGQGIQARFHPGSSTYLYGVEDYDNFITTNWSHVAMVYDSQKSQQNLKWYVDGELYRTENCTGSVLSSLEPIYIGYDSDSKYPDLTLDELKIYDKALTQEEIFVGFELWHSDFHCRTAQYIYAKIPGEVTCDPSNRIRATISGGGMAQGTEMVLLDKTGIDTTEKFLLKNSDLPGASIDYALTVSLISNTGAVIDKRVEYFYKPYDGYPATGIDENNSIRINGELFFPVTTCALDNTYVPTWETNNYINALHFQGYSPQNYTLSGWEEYLNIADDIKVTGPGLWEGRADGYSWGNSDIFNLIEYVDEFKNHDKMLMWNWADEPDYHNVAPMAHRAWTSICHEYDSQHPVNVGLLGSPYANKQGNYGFSKTYTYSHSAKKLGLNARPIAGIHVADSYDFDYYPIEFSISRELTFAGLTEAMDHLKELTRDMVPIRSWVEITDIAEADVSPGNPSSQHVKSIIWLNVVHGAKGIGWFHWPLPRPETNPEHKEVVDTMIEFVEQITELTPVVLGPDVDRNVTVTTNGQAGRIDIMVKEYENKIYLFAARVSEIDLINDQIVPEQNYDLDVTFNIDNINNGIISAYGEEREFSMVSGNFTDTFEPYGVHIYIIEPSNSHGNSSSGGCFISTFK